ncbi:hypothetical protein LMH87_000483 [Akanthomyces muscarius]|uniref:Uncharacterized protein n=1 Tax=Akanthomyces muscarius TaxID=2231603 RepID=A0A9W8UML9_AKAMU|nr:hypothetical protein LMH87_000483 [Akanthomyces muscarius]KAJ4155227.1 hypothetical protein LMH87_000483 [Akanthomyces muscarius]
MTPFRTDGYDSPVLEKISQFNNMSGQSRQQERRTTDALRRAVLGREEAEVEMERMKNEINQLQSAVEQGKERERKVGERLETVMDSYGRAKETHAHTQALWEKEIRRARKENFKSQSTIVKLQEELKTARTAAKINEECLQREKERSQTREQEAFTARYQIVGVQEQLDKALERVKVVEQERDAYKTAAKNEEVARIAAEGRLPLPIGDETGEFSSPNNVQKKRKRDSAKDGGRLSLSAMDLVGSAATEIEIEELALQVAWEKHRAERAQEMVEFLQAECRMHSCAGAKESRQLHQVTPRKSDEPTESTTPADITTVAATDATDDVFAAAEELIKEEVSTEPVHLPEPTIGEPEPMADVQMTPKEEEIQHQSPSPAAEEAAEAMDEDQLDEESEGEGDMQPGDILAIEYHEPTIQEPATEEPQQEPQQEIVHVPKPAQAHEPIMEAPKPNIGECTDETIAPPADAVPELEPEFAAGHHDEGHHESDAEERRESLPEPKSLGEHELIIVKSKKERTSTIFCPKEGVFRTVSEQEAEAAALEERFQTESVADENDDNVDIILPDAIEEPRSSRMYARTPSVEPPAFAIMSRERVARDRTSLQSLLSAPHSEEESSIPNTFNIPTVEDTESRNQAAAEFVPEEAVVDDDEAGQTPESPTPTMYSSTTRFKVTTTTVPVRDETSQHSASFNEKLRTPSASSSASFDLTDPALTPTMTREQALAKIRERRGRARSIAQATALVIYQSTSQQDDSKDHLQDDHYGDDTHQTRSQACDEAYQQADKQGCEQGYQPNRNHQPYH